MRVRMSCVLLAISSVFCATGVVRAVTATSGKIRWYPNLSTPLGCRGMELEASIAGGNGYAQATGNVWSVNCASGASQDLDYNWIHVTTGIYRDGSWCGDEEGYNNTNRAVGRTDRFSHACGGSQYGNPSGFQTWRADVGGEYWTGSGYSGWFGWQNSPNILY